MKILYLTCSSSGCERNWSVFEHIHSKKRNRLSQQRLNDLVYIKYNRTLRRRYAMRDKIDPISLSEIDDSNEWLLGKLDDSDNENDDNDLVFEDDDLRWSDVAQAVGVGESAYDFRSRNASTSKGASSSTSAKRSNLQLELVLWMKKRSTLMLKPKKKKIPMDINQVMRLMTYIWKMKMTIIITFDISSITI
ncbi:uncharacterized protein LOC142527816 [Primulina tabacum]|uniref:uncharacterized protein LOC142527816 n=1 Tax=Primulina tabacum TaxID=48773 RepID=UPI003F5A241C